MWIILIALAAIALLSIIYWYAAIPHNLPPGPINFPFLGQPVGRYGNQLYLQFQKWSEKYGDLFSFYFGNQLIVVITGYDLAKEAFLKQADLFTGKCANWAAKKIQLDQGLLMNDGSLWREHRRFALSALRDFGLGKPILENGIVEELQYVCETLKTINNQSYDVKYLLNNAVANIICQLVFGRRFDYENEEFQTILKCINYHTSSTDSIGLFWHEWMLVLPRLRRQFNASVQRVNEVKKFAQKFVDLERISFDPNDEPTNYIQAFLKAQQGDHSPNHFTDLQLLMSVFTLFVAGTETTATTIRWALLLCTSYPEVQKKIRTELDSLLGTPNRYNVPKLEHRKHLTYCEATLLEIQRYANLSPFIGRYMHQNAKLASFDIPKGAVVIRSNWAIHHNAKYFPEPSKFSPERFIDSNGKLIKPDTFVPFGMGKRSCLGEGMAKMELFLFFTYLLHKFEFSFPSDQPKPSLDHVAGLTLQPLPFNLVIKYRQ